MYAGVHEHMHTRALACPSQLLADGVEEMPTDEEEALLNQVIAYKGNRMHQ